MSSYCPPGSKHQWSDIGFLRQLGEEAICRVQRLSGEHTECYTTLQTKNTMSDCKPTKVALFILQIKPI